MNLRIKLYKTGSETIFADQFDIDSYNLFVNTYNKLMNIVQLKL